MKNWIKAKLTHATLLAAFAWIIAGDYLSRFCKR